MEAECKFYQDRINDARYDFEAGDLETTQRKLVKISEDVQSAKYSETQIFVKSQMEDLKKSTLLSKFKKKLEKSIKLNESKKFSEALSVLELIEQEIKHSDWSSIQENISTEINTLKKNITLNLFQERLSNVFTLLESGNLENALQQMQQIHEDAKQKPWPEISQLTQSKIDFVSTLKNFSKMLKISSKLLISDICEQLNLPRKEVMHLLIDWGNKFGIEIDGEMVLIKENVSKDDMMKDLVSLSFNQWTENEKNKIGKKN